jgi:hypothetical protein
MAEVPRPYFLLFTDQGEGRPFYHMFPGNPCHNDFRSLKAGMPKTGVEIADFV